VGGAGIDSEYDDVMLDKLAPTGWDPPFPIANLPRHLAGKPPVFNQRIVPD